MSKSISFFVAGVLVGALVVAVAFSFHLSQQSNGDVTKKLVLKLGHSLNTGHPVHLAMEHMKKRLEELSDGKVTLDIYPSEVLGSERHCIEQLQNGTLAMTKTSAAVMEGFVPEMSVFGLPYLFRDSEHFWQVLNSDLGKSLLKKGEARCLRGLCYYDSGSRNFYTVKRPIKSPADLTGLKIRTQSSKTAMDMVEAMGGAPTPIAWGELYTALAQGTVDGAENNLPSFISSKHYEICKHFSLDGHTRVPDMLLMSTQVFDKLDPQVQTWVQQAADESREFQRKLWQAETTKALETAKASGVKVYPVSTADFATKVLPMHQKVEAPKIKELIRQIKEIK